MRRKLNSQVLVFVLALVLFNSPVYAAQKLFVPLKVGQTFTFAVTDSTANTWEQRILISGKATISSMKKNFFVKDAIEVGRPEDPDEPDMDFLRSTRNELYIYDGFGVEHLIFQNAPVGTIWSYTGSDGNIKEYQIEAIETVVVPAGIFEGCLKIHKRCTNCEDENDDNEIHWIKPGFYTVKTIDYAEENPPVICELKSWTK